MTAHATSRGTGATDDPAVQAVAAHALDLIAEGARVGLGSGRAAAAFIARLGSRVQQGLRVVGVATSETAASQARQLGIPLADLDEAMELDLIVDGADEVAPNLDLVKGRGGALVRERIVASASQRQIILVGWEKRVHALGERGAVPVEVIPFGLGPVWRQVKALGLLPVVRWDPDKKRPLLTENGNLTLDCALSGPLANGHAARELERVLLAIPGVVDTGLFLGTAERVLVGHADGRVDELRRSDP
jgi:ribose 5-phosphate isomerase A